MSTFLQACRREPTAYTPIWIMRQAGRYQPEYRALRERVSFIELCKTPELACEVTVRAVDQLGVDAGIIFADILLILEPLQIGFEFTDDHGPKILNPIRRASQIDGIPSRIDALSSLHYVMDAIRMARGELKVPLIGFAGAPFTLASYAIEGGGSKNYYETKKLMYDDEGLWNAFMSRLSNAVASYLTAQIEAGAQAVQLFDSWIGCLSPADYRRYVLPHTKAVFDALPKDTPAIHFGTGNPELYPAMKEAGGDVIGIDWRVSLDRAWSMVGEGVGLQGNMDPGALLASPDVMRARASEVLDSAAGRPGHIFNLGHGIMPQAKVDQARALVDHVHETSQR
ncbi:MAG: uroporphyrinogen decarboxylase [Polyangiales bacterium]